METSNPTTPDEIKEYKKVWIDKGFSVKIGSSLDVEGKNWCRHNLDRSSWSMTPFTDSVSHTFIFEKEETAEEFATNFSADVGC